MTVPPNQTMQPTAESNVSVHVSEVRPRKDHRGVDLISDALPFGRLWYTKLDHAIWYAKFRSRSHDAVIRVYDEAGRVTEAHEQAASSKSGERFVRIRSRTRSNSFSACSRRDSSLKRCYEIIGEAV